MGRQRNMPYMKEQQKSPEKKELNEMEANNLPDTEFKTMLIRMLKELRGRMDELSDNVNTEIVSLKKDIGIIKKRTSQK